jgi:integrase
MPKPPKSGIRGVYWKNGQWWATWVNSSGKQEQHPVGSSKTAAADVAERGRQQAQLERLKPELREARERKLTVGQALDQYKPQWAHKRSAKDDERYSSYWRDEFGPMLVSNVKPAMIQAYRARRLDEGAAPATINRATSFLRSLYNWLSEAHPSLVNPASGRLLPPLAEHNEVTLYLRVDEEPKLLAVLTPENRRRVQFAIWTGIRSANQWAMRRSGVDLEGALVTIPDTKSGHPHYIPLSPELVTLLREQMDSHEHELVWPGRNGGLYHINSANQMIQRACVRAGIRVLNWHAATRHTFGKRAVERSDIRTVKEAMGHSSVTVTERYTRLNADRIRKLIEDGSAATG